MATDPLILNKVKDVKFLVNTALDSPTADSIGGEVEYITSKATSSPTSNSMAHRIEDIQTTVDAIDGLPYLTNEIKVYPTTPTGTTCNPSATANTYGSWVEIVAASGITSNFYIIGVVFASALALAKHMIQIGTGAGASEVTKISIPANVENTFNNSYHITFPKSLVVPADTRVAIRVQTAEAGQAAADCIIHILYWEAPLASS